MPKCPFVSQTVKQKKPMGPAEPFVRAHRLDDAVATVDTNFRTGHEARRVAGKEDDGTSKILGLAHL